MLTFPFSLVYCSKRLCDDLWELQVEGKGSNEKFQFSVKKYDDDLNKLYVACTRAKSKLCVTESVKSFLKQCDYLHRTVLAIDEGILTFPLKKLPLAVHLKR